MERIRHLPLMNILRYAIATVIIIDGIDKYFNALADWKAYTAPQIPELLNVSVQYFLYGLGILEIAVGISLILYARIGGIIVAGLMAGISINLLILGNFYNLLLQNLIIGLSALVISRTALSRNDTGA